MSDPSGTETRGTRAQLGQRDRQAPDRISELSAPSRIGVLRGTMREFRADNLTDLAAGLTYYGVLAIFPMIIVIVSILGLVGHSATHPIIANLSTVAPGPARSIITSAIRNVSSGRATAGVLFVAGLLGALWSASGYIAAFMRASNAVWDIEEGRPFYKTIPIRIGVTMLTVVIITVSALAVVLTGALADRVGGLLGLGSAAVTAFDIVKWPVMLVMVSLVFALLYYAGPNVRQPGVRWIVPGAVLAVIGWIVVSAAFAFYVANFSSYNKTYGALGGIVAFLVWLWLTNVVILFGAELNAELARARVTQVGYPADAEPYLPPRDDPGNS
jgi:membrane protein